VIVHARKRLGQHFLHDPIIIAKIVAAIAPRQDDLIVEIGPGLGAITQPLLLRVENLHAVEIDDRLATAVGSLEGAHKLHVHRADALRFDFSRIAEDGRPLRIVGNLPYNISTPLLFHLLSYRESISDMHLMLQKEVVERMCASPGSKHYGRLTVMLAAWTEIEACFDIGPGAFRPPPKVWSSLVHVSVRRRPAFEVENGAAFGRVVAHLFSMRRKTLRRSLKSQLDAEDIAALDIDPAARPETLEPSQFARIADAIERRRD